MEDLELLDNGLFHPCGNVARLYFKICKGGRGLISAKDCVLSKCNGLWDCLKESEELMFKEVLKEDFIVEKERKKEYDRRTKEMNEINWRETKLHENFSKSISDLANSLS